MDLNSVLDWLRGGAVAAPTAPKSFPTGPSNYIPASQNPPYPGSSAVEEARQNDYSYGQPYGNEFMGRSGRYLTDMNWDGTQRPIPALRTGGAGHDQFLGLVKKKLPEFNAIDDIYGKAALASQRSGLATLGYNPDKSSLDVFHPESRFNISTLGSYDPEKDDIYANVSHPETLVHESIHRGIQKLSETPFWKPEFNEFKENPMNEMLVRYLMQSKMGNPEDRTRLIPSGYKNLGKEQRDNAHKLFVDSPFAKERNKTVDAMEAAAAQAYAARRPGGPR